MEYQSIDLDQKDYICILTLKRPPINSINLRMREELDYALSELENRKDIRVLIITGAGEKGFSAGMDLSDVGNLNNGPHAIEIFNKIDRFQKPIIAAINGYAFGGACELALSCHFRFMIDTPKAKIGLPELNIGIIPGWGGIHRMTRIVGRSKAMDLIFFSRQLTPQEALEVGLIDKVSAPGELMKDTLYFAQELAKRPPIAVSLTLKSMIVGMEKGLDKGLQVDRESAKILAQTKDALEGFTAFLEKREPVFRGE
jgi:enoyl-CoA hydratase/carnithine racemase